MDTETMNGAGRSSRGDRGERRGGAPRPAGHQGARRSPGRSRHEMVRRSLQRVDVTGFRPEIEGLRALAVVAVVIFHADLLGMSGGFIGVDVFFVVSGYLITRLLVRELQTTGTVSLHEFVARRMRRLLPATLLVVIAVALAGWAIIDPLNRRDLAVDVVAAGTFSTNFVVAARLGDYFGNQLNDISPSPLLHMWSLAVEEQFYLLWPATLVALTRRPRQFRRLLTAAIVALIVLSAVIGVWMTASAPTWAYYMLPARFGELLAGALLALIGPRIVQRAPAAVLGGAGWAGLATIAVTCWVLDGSSIPFPGVVVWIPVAATLAAILGSDAASPSWSPRHVLSTPPMQWIGRHSYSIYLWHWPVLILAATQWGPLGWWARLFAVAVAIGFAVVAQRLVEDPIRRSPWWSHTPTRSLALGAAFCLIVPLIGIGLANSTDELDGGQLAAAPVLDLDPASAPAVDGTGSTPLAEGTIVSDSTAPSDGTVDTAVVAAELARPDPPSARVAKLIASVQRSVDAAAQPRPVPSNLSPSLRKARTRTRLSGDGCINVGVNDTLQPCEYGRKSSSKTMLLYGDSHAAHWFEALEKIANDRGYKLIVLVKGGCPVADVVVPTPVLRYTCPAYRTRVIEWIRSHRPEIVVAANSYTQYTDPDDVWAAGVESTMARLAEVADSLVIIGDNPSSTIDPPACLADHLTDASACATTRDEAIHPARIAAEVVSARAHDALFVDTTEWMCNESSCPAVLGNLLLLRDETHLTAQAAAFFAPLLSAAMSPVLG